MQHNHDPRLDPLPNDSIEQHEQFVIDWIYGNHIGEFSPLLSANLHLGNKDRLWHDSSHFEAFNEYLQNKWGTDRPSLDVHTLIAQGYIQEYRRNEYMLTPYAHDRFAPRDNLHLRSQNDDPRKENVPKCFESLVIRRVK